MLTGVSDEQLGNVSEQLEREAGRLLMVPLKVLTFEKGSVGLLWWPDL